MARSLPSSIPPASLLENAPRVDPLVSAPDLGRGWSKPARAGRRLRTRVPVAWELSTPAARDLMLHWRDHADAWVELALRAPGAAAEASAVSARFVSTSVSLIPTPGGWRALAELELAQ